MLLGSDVLRAVSALRVQTSGDPIHLLPRTRLDAVWCWMAWDLARIAPAPCRDRSRDLGRERGCCSNPKRASRAITALFRLGGVEGPREGRKHRAWRCALRHQVRS